MTIGGWIIFGFIAVTIAGIAFVIFVGFDSIWVKVASAAIAVTLIFAVLFGMLWYYKNTAAGQREFIDQKSNFSNGLERKITVYTANGEIIAQYEGKIDIEGNDGGYVLFDYNGKRYMYYNCFVESIADLGE